MATPIIALDVGHGLKTPGKQTPTGIKEWALGDKVRDKVVAYLAPYDVKIIHTDNDEGNTDESLQSRVSKYLSAGAKAFVSIHHNAFTGTWNGATGVEAYTDMNPIPADTALAEAIYNRLVKYTGLKGRGIKKAAFTVINQNKIPAVLIEGGFMDGSKDYKVITSEAGQDAYAKAVAEGLIEFCKLKKKAAPAFKPYLVKVKVGALNIRRTPNWNNSDVVGVITNRGTYTIVGETMLGSTKFGKLKSGAGWISLHPNYVKKV